MSNGDARRRTAHTTTRANVQRREGLVAARSTREICKSYLGDYGRIFTSDADRTCRNAEHRCTHEQSRLQSALAI